jgi:pimeloyl-ACP methyl ester carboxylesterase
MESETLERAVALAAADPAFALNAAGWNGSITIVRDGDALLVRIDDGVPSLPSSLPALPEPDASNVVWSADSRTWAALLCSPPPPPCTDPWGATSAGLTFEGGTTGARQHAALRRFCELMRHAANGTDPSAHVVAPTRRHGHHDAATGRYIYLDMDGLEYRVYYETAGSGIPLLCQHTAGSDGRQWRHVLEDERITSRYQVVVYDLPFHGKSLPPAGDAWWARKYQLTTHFAMQVPTRLAQALGLNRPVFAGSSIGGMLALDLARYHPDDYRAVVAIEGGLKVDMSGASSPAVVHASTNPDPALHAELMMMVMAPQAPETYRQETRLHYAQGAPGVFTGDLYYYIVDHDLTGEAHRIDTSRCKVFMLTGEYDHSCVAWSERAAREIPGADLQVMKGLGHFPMSEDPVQFASYFVPILERIADAGD